MPGKVWLITAKNMSKNNKAYRKFYNGIGTRVAVIISYSYSMSKFMDFLVESKYIKSKDDFDKLARMPPKKVTEMLQEYVFDCNNRVKGVSSRSYLSAPELFFDMNDVLWNRRIVKKSIKRDDCVPGGAKAATNDDALELIESCINKLESALLHFFLSTGTRPGGISDPVLKKKHLKKMDDDCFAIRVYDESKEGYWAFLTPEASKALNDYFNWRSFNGEQITDESALFVPLRGKGKFVTDFSARDTVYKIIRRSNMKRVKTGNRYDKAVIYMFRKRFNGILKMDENSINSNLAEKLMAHNSKEIKLDTRYLDPPIEKLFAEFRKAIPELTVNPKERQALKIKEQQEEIAELQQTKQTVTELEIKYRQRDETMKAMQDELERQKIFIESMKSKN